MTRAADRPRLDRLHRWLTLEGAAGVLAVAGFWLPLGPVLLALTVGAVLFAPALIHSLWALRRPGWLVAFAVWVGGAGAAALALPEAVAALRLGLALAAFYSYTWALRLGVSEWKREAEEAVLWARTQARWATDPGASAA